MRCRVCFSPDASPVPFELPAVLSGWVRCAACGSDSNPNPYDPSFYPMTTFEGQSAEELRRECRSNCDWFGHHHTLGNDKSFLEVGSAHGATADVMRSLGWSPREFDVCPTGRRGVTVHPCFSRWLFPHRFAAVMCREVVEHVESPRLLLHELHGVCVPGGLVQVQTPVPLSAYHRIPYQPSHLFLATPAALRGMLNEAMLDVVDERHWDLGQAYLCRARK